MCERVLESQPNSDSALALLGAVLFERGDLQAAVDALQRALAANPACARAAATLGALLFQAKQPAAVAYLLQAVKLDPRSAASFVHLGQHYAECGQDDRSIRCYRKAVSLNPDLEAAGDPLCALLARSDPAALQECVASACVAAGAGRAAWAWMRQVWFCVYA